MADKIYIRTDKNGTKIYHDYTCPRCCGHGGSQAWVYTGWTCYECGGSGKTNKPSIIKEYTPEYQAKLDAQRAARAAKRAAERFQKNVEGQGEWLEKKGFGSGKIYVVTLEDTFSVKDELKAAGAHFDYAVGWYFSSAPTALPVVELTKEECFEQSGEGLLVWKEGLDALIASKMPKEEESEYIGQVGDKVQLTATYKKMFSYETHFTYHGETNYIHQFETEDGNIIVWKTSCTIETVDEDGCYKPIPTGSKVALKGSIKAHEEYKGKKQTILTRCKVNAA